MVDKSLSLLNKTHTEVAQNRKALNKLTNATSALHNFVEDMKFQVLSMGPLVAFGHLQSKIHHIFHVVFSSLRQTYWDMQMLQSAVINANHGKLPIQLLTPEVLLKTLHNIVKNIPRYYQFPREFP